MMMRVVVIVAAAAGLAGCNAMVPPNVSFGGPPLVSGKSPPATLARNSEPQSVNSLPPGAEGIGAGPQATAPNYGSVTVRGAL